MSHVIYARVIQQGGARFGFKSPNTSLLCCIYMGHVTYKWVTFEHTELPAKLLDYFLRSNKSNINPSLIRMSHVTWLDVDLNRQILTTMSHINESCRKWMSRFTHKNESCHRVVLDVDLNHQIPTTQTTRDSRLLTVCCSVLQCVAACCSVCCSVMLCVAVRCNALQCDAVCCIE